MPFFMVQVSKNTTNIMKRFLKIWTVALMVALGFAACEKNEENPTDNSGAPANNLKAGEVQIRVRTNSSKKVSFYVRAKTLTIKWGDGSTEEFNPNGVENKFEHTYAIDCIADVQLQATELIYFKTYDGEGWRIVFGDCDLNRFETKYAAYCSYIDLSKCARLAAIGSESSGLSVDSLNVANCTALKVARCSSYVEWINVRGCTALEELDCDGVTSLDVSTCIALKRLNCRGYSEWDSDTDEYIYVGLTSLDVSKNTKLEYLNCSYNQLDAAALNALFQGLPTLKGNSISYNYGECDVMGNPGAETCDKSIAEKKGWTVSYGAMCTVKVVVGPNKFASMDYPNPIRSDEVPTTLGAKDAAQYKGGYYICE
jgi:hypothetical protein